MNVSGEFGRIRVVAELVPPPAGTAPVPAAGGGGAARGASPAAAVAAPSFVDGVETAMVRSVHLEHRGEIQAAVINEIRRDLGAEVQVDDFVVTKGSVELLFVLTTSYTIVKNFNEYVETLSKAAENVRRLVHAVLRQMPPADMQLRSWSDFEVGAGVERSRRVSTTGDGADGGPTSYGPGVRGQLTAPSASALMLFVLALNSLLAVALLVAVLVRT